MSNSNSTLSPLARIQLAFREDPLKFFRDGLGVTLDEQQSQLVVEACKERSRVMVKSARGTGKTFIITGLTLYFLLCFKDVNIRILSPSEQQLKTVFMREIRKHISNMNPLLKDFFEIGAMSIYNKKDPLNMAQCVTASVEKPENVSGVHSKKQIYLLDEASAISDKIYSTILGSLGTAEGGGHFIGVSNPNRGGSFYADLFFKDMKGWTLLTFTAMKCAQIGKEFIEEMLELYGEEGDEYRVSVLGEFPRADSSAFIPESLVEGATDRYLERSHYLSYPLVMGVDIARSLSGDKTVFVIRQGPKIHDIISFKTDDTMISVGRILDTIQQYSIQRIFIDATGVGGGPSDRLKEIFKQRSIQIPIVDVVVGRKSNDPLQYYNLRAELWGEMRQWLVDADIPDHYELRKELVEMTWGYSGKMSIQLTTKKKLASSPDHADALSMTFYESNLTTRSMVRYTKPRKIKRARILWA